MTDKMKRLMLTAGLLTALTTTVIMHSGKESASSVQASSMYDSKMLQQLVIQKGTQWITQTTYKLLQTN